MGRKKSNKHPGLSQRRKSRSLIAKRLNQIKKNKNNSKTNACVEDSSNTRTIVAGIASTSHDMVMGILTHSVSDQVATIAADRLIDIDVSACSESTTVLHDVASEKDIQFDKELPELFIENHVELVQECLPRGNRIIDISHFLEQIRKERHDPFDCSFLDMKFISEERKGLHSVFNFECKLCKKYVSLSSTPEAGHINNEAVVGAVSIGIGYSQSHELLSTLNIPYMAQSTYATRERDIGEKFRQLAWKSMEEAGAEESQLAKELGEIDDDGLPCITVITDGAWSKRSYNVNYNALSGVACIIGQRTGKLLFLGVKNKYCSMCDRNNGKSGPPAVHLCFKNFSGSSTGMESEIIVEGFKQSINMHNLKYTYIVGDGDSSVYKKLLEARPYGSTMIHKIECRNHIMRNFSKKIYEVAKNIRSRSKHEVVPVALRNLVKSRAVRIRVAVQNATNYRIKQDTSLDDKIKGLKGDLENIPSHLFGEHLKCAKIAYFPCNREGDEQNFVPDMKKYGTFEDLSNIMNRLIYNIPSLLQNMDTNEAEHYNSVLCKFIGGKRINFSLRGSYELRCNAASISFNSDGSYHEIVHRGLRNRSLPTHKRKYVTQKINTLNNMKKHRLMAKHKRKRLHGVQDTDADYGPNTQNIGNLNVIPDLQPDEYLEEAKLYLEKKFPN